MRVCVSEVVCMCLLVAAPLCGLRPYTELLPYDYRESLGSTCVSIDGIVVLK